MELKKFVSESLVNLVKGIEDAHEKLEKSNAEINPQLLGSFDSKPTTNVVGMTTRNSLPVTMVSFDLAVTVSDGKQTEGGIAIFTGAFGLGSKGKSDQSHENISRIKFNIPVAFPIKT